MMKDHRNALALFAPVAMILLISFAVFMATQWQAYVRLTGTIVLWSFTIAGVGAIVGLAWCAAKALRALIDVLLALAHGSVDVYRNLSEARGQHARNLLLHTDLQYVVYLEGGRVKVHSIADGSLTGQVIEDPELEQLTAPDAVESLPAPLQTFRELLASGMIQAAIARGEMLLGYVAGQWRYGSWLDLYSCGIGGVSGSGKSTTVRFLLFQAVLAHALLIMVDPHIEEEQESLAAQFRMFKSVHVQPPCDDNPNEVAKRVRWLMREYTRRKAHGVKGPPILFVLDEFNAIVRRMNDELRKELADLLLTIAQEGRKFALFAMVIGQRWSEQDLGGKNYGAAIRSSLASTLAHRFTDEDQARKLVGGKNGPRCLELEQGHYLFRDTQGGLTEMITPLTLMQDGLIIQQLLGLRSADVSASSATSEPTSTEPLMPALDVRPVVGTDMSFQARRVLELLKEKRGQNEIIEEVWGLKSTDGRPYRTAVEEYRAILAGFAERVRV